MKKYTLGIIMALTISLSLTIIGWKPLKNANKTNNTTSKAVDSIYHNYVNNLYHTLRLNQSQLSLPVFEKALTGFINLKKNLVLSDKSILTIVNFDQLSTEKRLYLIDVDKKALLMHTWVAHGQRSGNNVTSYFSNLSNSYASSLGFYLTGEIYNGIHGKSLKLDGLDEGFNENARKRDIVVHGAPYVSETTINKLGRLGRSQGCPAVAPEIANEIIEMMANKTVLFINKSNEKYSSKYLDENFAAQTLADEINAQTVSPK